MPLLPSAFQDRETMQLGRKVEKPQSAKECPIAAFERGEHLKNGSVVRSYNGSFKSSHGSLAVTAMELQEEYLQSVCARLGMLPLLSPVGEPENVPSEFHRVRPVWNEGFL